MREAGIDAAKFGDLREFQEVAGRMLDTLYYDPRSRIFEFVDAMPKGYVGFLCGDEVIKRMSVTFREYAVELQQRRGMEGRIVPLSEVMKTCGLSQILAPVPGSFPYQYGVKPLSENVDGSEGGYNSGDALVILRSNAFVGQDGAAGAPLLAENTNLNFPGETFKPDAINGFTQLAGGEIVSGNSTVMFGIFGARPAVLKYVEASNGAAISKLENEQMILRHLAKMARADGMKRLPVSDVLNHGENWTVMSRRMDYHPLHEVLRRILPLGESNYRRDAALGVTRNVAWLHQYGVVHQDIKPENILVFSSGGISHAGPVILDFGEARLYSSSETIDVRGVSKDIMDTAMVVAFILTQIDLSAERFADQASRDRVVKALTSCNVSQEFSIQLYDACAGKSVFASAQDLFDKMQDAIKSYRKRDFSE